MKTNTIALALCFGAMMFGTGCGKSKALLAYEEYEKAACACKDAACANAASQALAAKSSDLATAGSGDTEAISKATTNAGACISKAVMSGIPAMPGAK